MEQREMSMHGRVASAIGGVGRAAWLPAGLLALITLADFALQRSRLGLLTYGAIDWVGHLATAGLVLLALVGAPWLAARRWWTVGAIAGAVLIDLDHLMIYAGWEVGVGGRPFSHSLATTAVLGLLWLITRRTALIGGLAVGTLLHFVRDLATGPGVALFWPVSRQYLLYPYVVYLAVVVVLAVIATGRAFGGRGTQAAGS